MVLDRTSATNDTTIVWLRYQSSLRPARYGDVMELRAIGGSLRTHVTSPEMRTWLVTPNTTTSQSIQIRGSLWYTWCVGSADGNFNADASLNSLTKLEQRVVHGLRVPQVLHHEDGNNSSIFRLHDGDVCALLRAPEPSSNPSLFCFFIGSFVPSTTTAGREHLVWISLPPLP